jgi:peptide/nickel transport system substrate-binding protein
VTRRIRWQILIAVFGAVLVLGLMARLAVTSAAVPRPETGGAYAEGLTSLPQQLNPLVSDPARDPAAADIRALLFDGLMRIGADGLPEPALAQSWNVDDTGQVYTFTLRADVSWHDGQPLTADDAIFTLRAIQNRNFSGDPNVSAVWRDVLVDKVGERTIRCRLVAPFAPFLTLATFPILPAHLLASVPPEQWAGAAFSQKPVGTGPYQLTELTAEHALLAANPRYYGGQPFIDNLELRFYPNTQAARNALVRGDIQGLGYMGTAEAGGPNLPRDVVRHVIPLDSAVILGFNMREQPLSDLGLRRALAEGLDKDELIQRALDGQGVRLDTPMLTGWWAASQKPNWYAADKQRAADALASLGYTPGPDGVRARDGKPLAFELLTSDDAERTTVANEIARQWGQIGVKVDVRPLGGDELRQRLDAHDFTLALYGVQRLGADPDVYELWHSSQAAQGNNYAGLADDQIDELLANARQDRDISTRTPSYEAFQDRWVELAPSITLYQPLFVYAATSELEGLDFGVVAPSDPASGGAPPDVASSQLLLGREARFRNVSHWFIRSSRVIDGQLR